MRLGVSIALLADCVGSIGENGTFSGLLLVVIKRLRGGISGIITLSEIFRILVKRSRIGEGDCKTIRVVYVGL